jgi:hypothetical protein
VSAAGWLSPSGREFQRIEPSDRGALESAALAITSELAGTALLARDAASGDVLLTTTEAAEAARQQAQALVAEVEIQPTGARERNGANAAGSFKRQAGPSSSP